MTHATDIVTGKLTGATRLNTSMSGNPRFVVTIESNFGDTRQYRTQTDSAFNYDVDNLLHSGARRVFHISRGGYITHDSDPTELSPGA